MVQELPTGYYLDNFLTVLNFVDKLYPDILEEGEHVFSGAFHSCSMDARRLYVRLVSRKGPHFRSDKLNYPEITNLAAAVDELAQSGLLEVNRPPSSEAYVSLLLRGELIQLLTGFPDRFPTRAELRGLRKPDLASLAISLDPEEIHCEMGRHFHIYTPLGLEALLVYRLLFFGNLHQDLTEFVLLDLGLLRYENYAINQADRLFNKREILQQTLVFYQLRDAMYQAMEMEDSEALSGVLDVLPEADHPSLVQRRDRILNRCGSWYERQKEAELALACYEESTSAPARERIARIYDRLGCHERSLSVCETIYENPLDEMEWEFAERFRARQQKKLGLPPQNPPKVKHPLHKLVLDRDPQRRIEPVVLQHYQDAGVKGFYSENHFWQGLFGLAFWDIIFMPVRGAFFNQFQRGPKGLFSNQFRQLREEAVSKRLREIGESSNWASDIMACYEQKYGLANYLVHWSILPAELLQSALAVLKQDHVVAILDRFSRNPGEFKTGFPDLFIFKDKAPGYELMEVKGPGDQLQPNQKRWLRYFSAKNIPYSIARISWREP